MIGCDVRPNLLSIYFPIPDDRESTFLTPTVNIVPDMARPGITKELMGEGKHGKRLAALPLKGLPKVEKLHGF